MSDEQKCAPCGWFFLLLLFVFVACASDHEETRIIAGKAVHKVTEYYSRGWGSPFRDGVENTYWVYTDSAGNEIKHGPSKSFYGNGQVEYETNFVDGKQDGLATRWNIDGKMTQQTFWRMGDETGWANYDKGVLTYAIESIFEDGHRVATKKFELDRWSLQFVCGAKIDRAIDQKTGELIPLRGPARIACQQ